MAESEQSHFLVKAWYQGSPWLQGLRPLTALYRTITAVRRGCYQHGLVKTYRAPVPVIVVGNITVGGTGKTPLVVALANFLKNQGYKPGIVSRGYGSTANNAQFPYTVNEESPVSKSGDEPLLIASRTRLPVVIDPQRSRAVWSLITDQGCDCIIADDGLQHYHLERDLELVVVDGERAFGNGLCLPAGPLRESLQRLQQVDYIIANGAMPASIDSPSERYEMRLKAGNLINVSSGQSVEPGNWQLPRRVHAVAGIGNPGRFYSSLSRLGFELVEHSFADHHPYQLNELQFEESLPVIMTEKDAVKIRPLAEEKPQLLSNCWYLPVEADLPQEFYQSIEKRLAQLARSPIGAA